MFLRAICAAAILTLLAHSAVARGGGGSHGASGRGFHWGRTFPHHFTHQSGSHHGRAAHHDRSREKNAHHGTHGHHAHADGTWHTSRGFGDMRKSSSADGEWHMDAPPR